MFTIDDREGTIVLASQDGGIEIRVSREMAERHAEVAWNKFIGNTPDVITPGPLSAKCLLPGYVRSYMAANDLAFDASVSVDELSDERVFPTVPAEIPAPACLERALRQQTVQYEAQLSEK